VKGGEVRERKASVHEVSVDGAMVMEVVSGIEDDGDGVMQNSKPS